MTKDNKKSKITNEKPVSLSSLDFKNALEALLKFKPEEEKKEERKNEKPSEKN